MKILKNIFRITIPSVIILLILLEIFFSTVIPASHPPLSFFDEQAKMYSYSNEKESGYNTSGRLGDNKTSWRINNFRWNYPVDYYPANDRKLIAVIGDSYIEGFQVNVDEIYPFLLKKKLKNNYDVYAFGKSGAPLSQYLHVSRYVNKNFDPDILIFNLVANDFEESIRELYPDKFYFLQLSVDAGDSITETAPRSDHTSAQYKPLKRLLYKSALFRYIYFNLKITGNRPASLENGNKSFEANVNTPDAEKNKALIIKATNYLLKTIREENKNKRVIIVMDTPRESIYNNTLKESKIIWMNGMMKTLCSDHSVEYIDLTSYMEEDFRQNGTRFNSELDGHWNAYGHAFVSQVLYQYLMKDDLKKENNGVSE